MADESHRSTTAEASKKETILSSSSSSKTKTKRKKKKKSRNGMLSGLWRWLLGGSSSEEYEKRLQFLSKEEASIHARMKRRSLSTSANSTNVIIFSLFLETIAVAYAITTTRSVNVDWKMRAARVSPMFGIPILSTLIYSALVSFRRMFDRKDQKTLERLRAERQAKIDELKERTNYYTTQQLIQRYDLDPAAKAAATTVLASKLGADSGLKVYLGDESNTTMTLGRSNDIELMNFTGLQNRKASHIKSNSTGTAALTQFINETSVLDYSGDGEESPTHSERIVDQFRGPRPNHEGWLARIAALIVGEDPTQCYALICANCHMHNGLARKEDFAYITYYCPHCLALNSSQQSDNSGSGLSSGKATPTERSSNPMRGTAALSANSLLTPVQELPGGYEKEADTEES